MCSVAGAPHADNVTPVKRLTRRNAATARFGIEVSRGLSTNMTSEQERLLNAVVRSIDERAHPDPVDEPII